jgi:hypothetical protein
MSGRAVPPALLAVLLAACAPGIVVRSGFAQAGSPDASYREALTALHDAARDTADHASDPARLDALGAALIKLARFADADKVFRRVLVDHPDDRNALAGAGHVALCRGDEGGAESMLVPAGDAEGAARDLYLARLRRHEYALAAPMAEAQGEPGRRALLERLDGKWPPATAPTGPDAVLGFVRAWPVPLVRVTMNRQSLLMAVDPGAGELLIDPMAARRCRIEMVAGERTAAWCGSRVAARNAVVQSLQLGSFELAGVPAAVTSLHRYSLAVNPEGSDIAGVIGLPVLERFGVTLDFRRQRLELRAARALPASVHADAHVPFERWDENMLVVYGSLQAGRRMAFWLGTGLPEAVFGAPQEIFDEVGARPGKFANLVRAVGSALQGRPWSQVVLSTLSVGPLVVDHVESWSGAMDASELWRQGSRLDGLLGPRFFNGRRVTFDWEKSELAFEDAK